MFDVDVHEADGWHWVAFLSVGATRQPILKSSVPYKDATTAQKDGEMSVCIYVRNALARFL